MKRAQHLAAGTSKKLGGKAVPLCASGVGKVEGGVSKWARVQNLTTKKLCERRGGKLVTQKNDSLLLCWEEIYKKKQIILHKNCNAPAGW